MLQLFNHFLLSLLICYDIDVQVDSMSTDVVVSVDVFLYNYAFITGIFECIMRIVFLFLFLQIPCF